MKIWDIKINDNYLCFVIRTKLNKDVNKQVLVRVSS